MFGPFESLATIVGRCLYFVLNREKVKSCECRWVGIKNSARPVWVQLVVISFAIQLPAAGFTNQGPLWGIVFGGNRAF